MISFDRVRQPVKESDRRPGPFPYYGASGIVDNVDQYLFDGDYLLVAEDGENLRTRQTPIAFMATGRFWVNNHAHVLQANSKSDTRYLMYALRVADVSAFLTGSTMPKLTAGNLARIPIPLRSLDEQRAIASILGALDDKIELNRKMSATLEAIARALFKSWFVDFDPVRAKAEGRDPGLPAEIAALFPDSLTHDGSRPVPINWSIARLDDFAKIGGGKQLPTDECKRTGKHQVFGANGVMGYADRYTHDDFVAAFGRVGANCGSIHWTYRPSWINNNASAIVPDRYPEYVLQTLLDVDFVSMRTGSAQPFIPNSSLAAAPILQAPDELISVFCLTARPLRLRQGALDAESRVLATLRDELLPKLISGELRVGEAERVLAASA